MDSLPPELPGKPSLYYAYFQNPQLPPKSTASSYLWVLICCSCGFMREFPSSSLIIQPLVIIFGFGLTSVDCLLVASVTQPLKRRESSSLLVLTCSDGQESRRDMANTIGMCEECLQWQKPGRSCDRLKQVCSPRGTGPKSCIS